MTLKLLKTFNVNFKINKNYNEILIQSSKLKSPEEFFIEPDLSSASYFAATMPIVTLYLIASQPSPVRRFSFGHQSIDSKFKDVNS